MSELARTAAMLHERHGDLLTAPRLVESPAQAEAVEALDAARLRLRGDDGGRGRDQLVLDVSCRG